MRSFLRAARGVLFLSVYALFMLFGFGLPQRLFVWPLAALLPSKRVFIVGFWYRAMARSSLALARVFAGVRLRVEGRIAPGSFVFVMNHQSLLDICIAHAQMQDPYPLIPTRALYARGIPGISPLIRMGRYPLVRQTQESRRSDLVAIARAASEVERGEQSLLIFPEGHRTRDGEIGPFMRAGLRAILLRAKRPVYLLVVDGFWQARTAADTLFNFAGSQGRCR
jgi:1-acyl-sn-glycerol-3-phosphate acyltransferase